KAVVAAEGKVFKEVEVSRGIQNNLGLDISGREYQTGIGDIAQIVYGGDISQTVYSGKAGTGIIPKVLLEIKQIERSGNIAVNIVTTSEGKAVIVLSVKEGVKFKVKTVKEALSNVNVREVIVDVSCLNRSEIKQVEAEVVRIINLNKDKQITLISETQGEIVVRVFNNKNIKGEVCRLPENVMNNLRLDIENNNYKQGLTDVVDIVSNQGKGINRPVDITINYAKNLESKGLIVNPINPRKGVLAVTTKGKVFDLGAMEEVLGIPAREIIVDFANIKSNRQRQKIQEMIVEARNNDINKQITLIDTSIKGKEGIINSDNHNINKLNLQKAEVFIQNIRDGLKMREIALIFKDRVVVEAKTPAGTISPKTPGVGVNAAMAGVLGGITAFTRLDDLKQLLLGKETGITMDILEVKGKISMLKLKAAIDTIDFKWIEEEKKWPNIIQSLVKTVVLNRRARGTVLIEGQKRVVAICGEILAKLPVERHSEALQMARDIDISQNRFTFPHLKEVAKTLGMKTIILKDTASESKQFKQIKKMGDRTSDPILITMPGQQVNVQERINNLKNRFHEEGYMDKSFEGGLVVTSSNPIVISSDVKNVGVDFMNALQKNIEIAARKGFQVSNVQVKVITKEGSKQQEVMKALEEDLKQAGMKIIPRFRDKTRIIVSQINKQTMANLVQNKGGIKVADAQPPIPYIPVLTDHKEWTSRKGPKNVYILNVPDIGGITAIIGSN
ncbi:hypothetical protein KAI68_03400, partial [bacterium]|nr:hypothetical protein [bacterium]